MIEQDLMAPNWLKDLKPGDKVIVCKPGRSHSIPLVKEVKSIGKKLITLVDYDKRFNKQSGDETGDYWDKWSLKEATPEAIAEVKDQIEKQQILERIQRMQFERLPLSVLRKVDEAITQTFCDV